MRDPARIDRITELLREAWHLLPGFRLTQFVMTIADEFQDAGALWHVEDDGMERLLRSYIAANKSSEESDGKTTNT